MNLLQRINEVRKAVDYIQKDKSVSTGASGSYKAVTHDMVTAMIRDHLVKHGVVIVPSLVTSKMSPPFKADGKQWLYEATYDFAFCNIDDPADKLTVRVESHANDNADKAPGKALSYAKKYAVLKVFEIETGEDEESRAPEEFNLDPWLEQMGACTTLPDLQKAFTAAFVAAAKDKEAQKALIKVKDNKKAELSK